MKLRITRIDKELPLPEYHTPGAVAFDLYSRMDVDIPPRERADLPSNFIIEVPKGHYLMLANGVGTIDQDYHGPKDEIGISVWNFTDEPVMVKRGDRVAQALIIPIMKAEFQEVEKIKEDSRGGFGSTG